MNMIYKNYEFPVNPSKIELSAGTNVHCSPIFDGNSAVENVSVNPVIVKCSGELFGEEGRLCCDRLQMLLRERSAGWLFAPELSPIEAFMTSLSITKGASKGAITFELVFTENCNNAKGRHSVDYTICRAGENAFDIANRCDTSVEKIMSLNSFASPFEINEGDKVVLK